MKPDGTSTATRRAVLVGGAGFAVTLAAPAVHAQRASAGRVTIRGLGGAYQAAMEKAIFEPFTAETGIQVVTMPATAAQIRAAVEAGRVQIDVIDLGATGQLELEKIGALQPIDYGSFRFTNPDDIHTPVRLPSLVGNLYFATVLAYRTDVFAPGSHPKNWAEFWDVARFPGPRTMTHGGTDLEFALMADGVAMDKLYPLDIDRGFAAMDRIKGSVVKWWETGAISAQLLERKEAVLGALWNGRAQDLIDKGAPLAIEWNQGKRQVQMLSISKSSPNPANALRLVDYALQPKVQAAVTSMIAYGPTNARAFDLVKPEDAAKLPSSPEHYAQSFDQDIMWWSANQQGIGRRWQSWALRR